MSEAPGEDAVVAQKCFFPSVISSIVKRLLFGRLSARYFRRKPQGCSVLAVCPFWKTRTLKKKTSAHVNPFFTVLGELYSLKLLCAAALGTYILRVLIAFARFTNARCTRT